MSLEKINLSEVWTNFEGKPKLVFIQGFVPEIVSLPQSSDLLLFYSKSFYVNLFCREILESDEDLMSILTRVVANCSEIPLKIDTLTKKFYLKKPKLFDDEVDKNENVMLIGPTKDSNCLCM